MTFWWLQGDELLHAERALAGELGISLEDLGRLDWHADGWTSPEGVFLGTIVVFGANADEEVMARIKPITFMGTFMLPVDFPDRLASDETSASPLPHLPAIATGRDSGLKPVGFGS